MAVRSVTSGTQSLRYTHEANRLAITLPAAARLDDEIAISVVYRGVPAEGLRLIDNI
jgi:hypothetical protein